MKNRIIACIAVFMMLLCGCGKEEEKTVVSGPRLYYLNAQETKLVSEEYELKADFKEAQVKELIDALDKEPEARGLKKLLPDDVNLLEYSFGMADQLILSFDTGYNSLSGIREILIRAGLVKTFCQVEGIDYVEFYINGISYMNGDIPVGMMSTEDFVESTASAEFNSKPIEVTLYFANDSGTALCSTTRSVNYSGDKSMEQFVVELLLEGPTEKEREAGMKACFGEGIQIQKVVSKDGVCYIDFNEAFMGKSEQITDQVVIYSIVDSLAELSNINKVQFKIDGEIRKTYQTLEFSGMFERNLDLLETEN